MSARADGHLRVGLLSDTHGSLADGVVAALADVDAIIHAGDIGPASILDELALIAPVTAVRGNCDNGSEHWRLLPVERLTIAGVRFLVAHDFDTVADDSEDVDVVVYGHTHAPEIRRAEGLIAFNPGSAGSGAYGIGPTVGILEIAHGAVLSERIVEVAPVGRG